MTEHLTPIQLSALADGELSPEAMAAARRHLDGCQGCASRAIEEWMTKDAIAMAGHAVEMPAAFREKMAKLVATEGMRIGAETRSTAAAAHGRWNWAGAAGVAAAAMVLLSLGGWGMVVYHQRDTLQMQRTALVAESCDLHIATMAANEPPQVVSSDRHTVKPWFQGKLPFSFNLPETLPPETRLDGANLEYLGDRPVAQLLFSIGRHPVSVFVAEKNGSASLGELKTAREGFQVIAFDAGDLEAIAVSDVDAARLTDLANSLQAAQR
jgi:anti-sigma factor RsiW